MKTVGTALLEHPADPVARVSKSPSIWRLGITGALVKSGVRIVYVDQCHGALSLKRTMLLTCNADWL